MLNTGLTVTLRENCRSEFGQSAEGRLNLQMSRMLCSWPSDGDPCKVSCGMAGVRGSEKVCFVDKGAAGGKAGIRTCLGLL